MAASFMRSKKLPNWSKVQRQIMNEKPKQQSEAEIIRALKAWLGDGEK